MNRASIGGSGVGLDQFGIKKIKENRVSSLCKNAGERRFTALPGANERRNRGAPNSLG